MTPAVAAMKELRRLVEEWDATSEFSENGLYLFTAALVGAARAAVCTKHPDTRQ